MSVKVEVCRKRAHDHSVRGPFLASFEQNIPAKEDFETNLKVLIQEKGKKKTALRMTSESLEIYGKGQHCSGKISEDSNQIEDSNTNQSGSSGTGGASSAYLIGVKDETTGIIKLYPVEQLFRLQQSTIKEQKSLNSQQSSQSNIAKSHTSHMEQKQMLVAEFGTVKSRKKVKQLQNNIVHDQNLSSNLKESIKERGNELEQDALAHLENEKTQDIQSKREFLPEFDLEAKSVNQIYHLSAIITQEELQSLTSQANQIMAQTSQKEALKINILTFYVRNIFSQFQTLFGGRSSQQLISKQLVYLDYLLNISNKLKLSGANLDDISAQTKIPGVFLRNILKNFYQASQANFTVIYQRTPLLQDKLISYIIVLALFIFDFKLEASQLSAFLRVDPKKFLNYAKEVGCQVKIKENKEPAAKLAFQIFIELKAPLKLVQHKKPMKKGK